MRFQSSIIIENQSLPHSKRSIIKGTFHYDNSVELTYFPFQRVQQAHIINRIFEMQAIKTHKRLKMADMSDEIYS